MSRIDVVVPCYNYGKFLKACVSSILDQSVRDLRILIINDASSDQSLSIAKELAESDERVSLLSHSENMGHIATYNEGIAWAEGDYFLLLSADDLLVPGALQRAIRVMDENPDIVLVYGDCVVWKSVEPPPTICLIDTFAWQRKNLVEEMCALATNTVPTPTAIVRTVTQKKVGGYRPELPHAGDLEMWLRLAATGRVAHIGAVQGIYRKHVSAMSNSYWQDLLSEYKQRKLAFDTFFETFLYERQNLNESIKKTYRVLAKQAFQSGVGYVRRGRIVGGIELMNWAMTVDHRLRYFPPLWRLAKIPGPEGCRWAIGELKNIIRKLVMRNAAKHS